MAPYWLSKNRYFPNPNGAEDTQTTECPLWTAERYSSLLTCPKNCVQKSVSTKKQSTDNGDRGHQDPTLFPTYPFVWSFYEILICCFVLLLIFSTAFQRLLLMFDSLGPEIKSLSKGYLPGKERADFSDAQWRNIRSFLPHLLPLMVVHLIISHSIRFLLRKSPGSQYSASQLCVKCLQASGDSDRQAELHQLRKKSNIESNASSRITMLQYISRDKYWYMIFNLVVCIATSFYIHGFYAIILLCYAVLHYWCNFFSWRRSTYGCLGPCLSWILTITALLVNGTVLLHLRFSQISESWHWMDSIQQQYAWSDMYRLLSLKMLSFNMDLYWAVKEQEEQTPFDCDVHLSPTTNPSIPHKRIQCCWSYNNRSRMSQSLQHYNVFEYFCYIFYLPLYIAGPTISFNAWSSQIFLPWYSTNSCVGNCEKQEAKRQFCLMTQKPVDPAEKPEIKHFKESGRRDLTLELDNKSDSAEKKPLTDSTGLACDARQKSNDRRLDRTISISAKKHNSFQFCIHEAPSVCLDCKGVISHLPVLSKKHRVSVQEASDADEANTGDKSTAKIADSTRRSQRCRVSGTTASCTTPTLAGPPQEMEQLYLDEIRKSQACSFRYIVNYSSRWIFCLVMFELACHYFYVHALLSDADNAALWQKMNTFDLLITSTLCLSYIWFKFVIIWRLFRLWALLDGIDPPENMNRCVFNNYSTEQFWRSWHTSFNQWLVRYIYIPLSGSRGSNMRRWINILVVFTFVALWHEINIQLLSWGWAVSLFILPELILKAWAFPKHWQWEIPRGDFRKKCGRDYKFFLRLRHLRFFKFVCVGAATINILLLIFTNLLGYGIGTILTAEWVIHLFSDLWENSLATGTALACYFTCANLQMFLRYQKAENR